MQQWIIAYQYWSIIFSDSRSKPDTDIVPTGYKIMDDSSVEDCLRELTDNRCNVWVWCRQDMRRIVEYMMSHYIYIKAAGGIVHCAPSPSNAGQNTETPTEATATPDDRILLINRNGHWDMAKGKVEQGETLRQAAIREVTEETGLSIASEGCLVIKTYHIYDLYGGWHLKQTSWFEMQDSGKNPIVPQEEEGISTAEWCPRDEWQKRLEGSYSMMALIADTYCNDDSRRFPLTTRRHA